MTNTDTPMLTRRERQVVVLIVKDMKYKDIAAELGLGYETVKTYAARIRKKLNLKTKVAVALWAERNIPKDEETRDVG